MQSFNDVAIVAGSALDTSNSFADVSSLLAAVYSTIVPSVEVSVIYCPTEGPGVEGTIEIEALAAFG